MELSLPSTFLSDLSFSGTSFAVMEGRVHTLQQHSLSSNGNYFQKGNVRLALEEAEEVSELEREIFSDKQQEIEKYMSWVIDFKLIRRIKTNNSKLQNLVNIYESSKDSSIEKFIMVDVFNAYNHENRNEQKIEVVGSKWEDIPEVLNLPSSDDLNSRNNSLDSILDNKYLLVYDSKCYILNTNEGNELNGFVVYKGKKLFLNSYTNLDKLEEQYINNLIQRIETKALEHGEEYIKILTNLTNKIPLQLKNPSFHKLFLRCN